MPHSVVCRLLCNNLKLQHKHRWVCCCTGDVDLHAEGLFGLHYQLQIAGSMSTAACLTMFGLQIYSVNVVFPLHISDTLRPFWFLTYFEFH